MNKKGLPLKLLGILAVALMVLACSPKKTDDQKAMEAKIAELQKELAALNQPEAKQSEAPEPEQRRRRERIAELQAELETAQGGGRERGGNRDGAAAETPAAETPQEDLRSIVDSIKAGGAGDPIPAALSNTISWAAGEGEHSYEFKINPDGSGTYGRRPCRWIVKGNLLVLNVPNYEYSVGGMDPRIIDYFNHAFWEVKDGLLYLTANEHTNTYVEDMFFGTLERSPFKPGSAKPAPPVDGNK